MTCYMRHMKDVFEELGIEYDKETRRIVDGQIRSLLNKQDAGCPEVWKEVKERLQDSGQKKEFFDALKKRIKKN